MDQYGFLDAPGTLGGLIREHDWEDTPLGPVEGWPASLKTCVSLMLNTSHLIWMGWGPELIFLYNDPYIGVLSDAKHPGALGRPCAQVWSEIWDQVGPLTERVLAGEAVSFDAMRLLLQRPGFVEEKYYSFSYSPIRDESGAVRGLFCPSIDATAETVGARRLLTLSELASRSMLVKTTSEACDVAAHTLARNPADVPFAKLYLVDEDQGRARLERVVGLDRERVDCVTTIALEADGPPPPREQQMRAALLGHEPVILDEDERDGVPLGAADQRIRKSIALPLMSSSSGRPLGLLVCAISPANPLDDGYLKFYDLVAAHAATAIQAARTAEAERDHAEKLAELDRAKTAFFSNISHEFRTPLTLLLGPIRDALEDHAPLPTAQRERLELALGNAQRLQKLVNSLLDFSRIEAGRMHAQFRPIAVDRFTRELVGSFRSLFEGEGLTLEVQCGPLEEPYYVDPEMWEKVLLNLLSNAFKFTFSGGVRVELSEDASGLAVCVEDTGIGIAPEHLSRVFERFHRIEGARSRTHEGTGIGLSMVQDLIRQMGGEVHAHSEQGRGSRFTIRLPRGSAHLPPDQIVDTKLSEPGLVWTAEYRREAQHWRGEGHEAQEAAAQPKRDVTRTHAAVDVAVDPSEGGFADIADSTASAHILVVDDNREMRVYLQRLLSERWQVRTASNGREALELLQRLPAQSRPELIVSDVMMPVMDGFELLAAVRENPAWRTIPLLLLSARAGEESRIEGLRSGADDYLVKPFSGRELTARIDTLLMRARLRNFEAVEAARLAAVFEQAPAGMALLRGPTHVFAIANPQYLQIINRERKSVVGLPIREALPELDGQGIYELLDQVLESGEPFIGRSLRVALASGANGAVRDHYFDFVYQPLFDDEGRAEGIAVICFDVTELDRARRTAESASRVKDEFLAMLGHELRNPLAPIMSALELMRMRGGDQLLAERRILERQARHLVQLVDDLLDVSRIAQGKVQLRLAPVEISEPALRAIEMSMPLIQERRHELRTDIPKSGLMANADQSRMSQVLSNLLINAAKYTEPGGHITIRANRSESGDIRVEVEDDGIGIEPERVDDIFDMFTQERQALDRSRGGLGLGLAIVRSITRLHGGEAQVRSSGPGRGTCFSITLPAWHGAATGSEAARAEHDVQPVRAVRLLIVDDNVDAARTLSELATTMGHQTRVAKDAASALNTALEFHPQVVLLDIGLPGIDGYELATRLRAMPRGRDMRLVALTGYGTASDRQRTGRSGIDAHLVKPISAAQLNETLGALVR